MKGLNSVVKVGEAAVSVQTQDRGAQAGYIESLVYAGGTVVYSRKIPYGSVIKGPLREEKLEKLVAEEHHKTETDLKNGRIRLAPAKPRA